MPRVDPITTEIIRNLFISAAEEMKINLARTAYNPVVFEMLDFAVGLFDSEANMIAQAPGLPVFLGTLRENVRVVTEDIGGLSAFRPGDLYLMNDPYTAGTHLLDVTCVSPIFFEEELVGFSAAKMHWLDIGGKDPGSWSNDAKSIYDEGLRLRSVKLYDEGKPVLPVFDVIRYNVRLGESVLGDLRAQIAAARTGNKRFCSILQKYGKGTVTQAIAQFMDHAEKMARLAVREIPDGTYQAVGTIDNDSLNLDRRNLPIVVTVTVRGSRMTVDLSGSQEQNEGPINCGLATTVSAVRVGFKSVTTPDDPINEGSFRSLEVVVPDNSMFNARYPAPVCQFGMHLITMIDTFFKALTQALPGKLPAGHYSDLGVLSMSGTDPRTGKEFIHVDSSSGGWGGRPHEDGESTLIAIVDGDSKNIPAEIVEHDYPLRLKQFALIPDSGGPGRFRGGLGHIRDFEVLGDEILVLTSIERCLYKPWGILGGREGAANEALLNPGTESEREVRKVTSYPLSKGDVLSIRSGGGGGYGPPWERDAEAVLADVRDEYVSVSSAEADYGVALVVTDSGFQVDTDRSKHLRERISRESKEV